MLNEAREILNWDPGKSWVIGDKNSDVALGRNANMGGALVLTGYGEKEKAKVKNAWPEDPLVGIFSNLPQAVDFILANTIDGERT